MKCPFRKKIVHYPSYAGYHGYDEEYFAECCERECGFYDREKHLCRRIESEVSRTEKRKEFEDDRWDYMGE